MPKLRRTCHTASVICSSRRSLHRPKVLPSAVFLSFLLTLLDTPSRLSITPVCLLCCGVAYDMNPRLNGHEQKKEQESSLHREETSINLSFHSRDQIYTVEDALSPNKATFSPKNCTHTSSLSTVFCLHQLLHNSKCILATFICLE